MTAQVSTQYAERRRALRGLPPIEKVRYLSETRPTGCIEFVGARNDKGYGHIRDGSKTLIATRVVWEDSHGEIPEHLHVLHHCDNPPCCNVEHLFLGTHLDNIADRSAKGRPSGPPQGAGGTKLTWATAAAIRAAAAGGAAHIAIAAEHGVSRSLVSRIVRGKAWNPAGHRVIL